jgi:hypothetical protein
VIREQERLAPGRRHARFYLKAHAQYQRLYAALREDFDRIAAL